jgi:antitoxin (DNA-binding transcriptional repressor) of toxin-antitoxin stability system
MTAESVDATPPRRFSLAQARDALPAIVRDVAEHGPVELTEGDEPVAVIVALDEYRRLAANRPGLWEAIQKFRAETDLDELDIDSVLEGVRDRSPGRDVVM